MNDFRAIANFRDVGHTVNVLAEETLVKEEALFRGGTIRDIEDLSVIRSPKTIVNLRKGRDPVFAGVVGLHWPAPDSVEVYHVDSGSNRKWIQGVLKAMMEPSLQSPFLVHCAAGKDRTGIIVAAILSILGVERNLIMEDYLLSSGNLQPKLFKEALSYLSDVSFYRRLELDKIRALFGPE